MTTFAPGIYEGIPMPVYRAADGENISALKEMALSPKHYLQAKNAPPQEPTDAQRVGTVVHSAILENDHSGYVVRPATFPHTIKGVTTIKPWDGRAGYCKEWKEQVEDSGKVPFSPEEKANLDGMIVSVKNHGMANSIIYGPGGRNEVCCFKKHTWTELLLKGRADRLTMDGDQKTVVVDVKTTGRGDGIKGKFSKEIDKWKYFQQSAFYQDLFEASFFCFVVVEKEAPYAVACYSLDKESIQIGRDLNDKYLAKVRECRDTGVWPCYSEGLETIALSDWAKKKAQEA